MNRTYTYRLYPTKKQIESLNNILELHRELYNAALEERREAWKRCHKNISWYSQSQQVTEIRKIREDIAQLNHTSCQQTLRRLNKAFDAFFCRIKSGEAPGYPRFQSRSRFNSITFRFNNGMRISNKHLYVHGIGETRVKWHREIPTESKIKQVVIRRKNGKWYAHFMLEFPDPQPVEHLGNPVGIDLGLKNLVTLSNGETVVPPKFFRKSEKKLRVQNRRLERCKRFSRGWKRAKQQLAKTHEHIANRRADFNHKLSAYLARTYSFIAVEDLCVKGLARTRLSKSANDAGWSQLVSQVAYKVESTGSQLVKVPRFFPSSRLCPTCGCINKNLKLSDREWTCECGAYHDRDINAAQNILECALSSVRTEPRDANVRVRNLSVVSKTAT